MRESRGWTLEDAGLVLLVLVLVACAFLLVHYDAKMSDDDSAWWLLL